MICGLCAAGLGRSGFRVGSGFGQDDGGRQRSHFFVLRPWRAKDASHAINILANVSGGVSECSLRAFIKLAFADADDRYFQAFKGVAESLTEEFTFSSVNQRMGSQYLFERREAAGGEHKNNRRDAGLT